LALDEEAATHISGRHTQKPAALLKVHGRVRHVHDIAPDRFVAAVDPELARDTKAGAGVVRPLQTMEGRL